MTFEQALTSVSLFIAGSVATYFLQQFLTRGDKAKEALEKEKASKEEQILAIVTELKSMVGNLNTETKVEMQKVKSLEARMLSTEIELKSIKDTIITELMEITKSLINKQ